MAATIFYEFSGGTPNYTVDLVSGITTIVDSQVQSSAGFYSFTGVTDGTYDIRIRDINDCLIQFSTIVVNCSTTTTTTTLPTTTTTTTLPTTTTTTTAAPEPVVFFAVNSLNIIPLTEVTNNSIAGQTAYASGETLQMYWTTDSGDTQAGTAGDTLTSDVAFNITMGGDVEVTYEMGNNTANILGLDGAGTDITGTISPVLASGATNGYFEFIIHNSATPTQKNFQIDIDINVTEPYELALVADASDGEYVLKSGGSFTNGYVTFSSTSMQITGKFD